MYLSPARSILFLAANLVNETAGVEETMFDS